MPATKRSPRGSGWDDSVGGLVHMPDSMSVHEQDRVPVFSGIYDQHGMPLYRHPPTVRIGFQKD